MTACSYPGCRKRIHAADLCRAHYEQLRRKQPLRPLRGAHGQLEAEPLVDLTLHLPRTLVAHLRGVGTESAAYAARLVLQAWDRGLPVARPQK